MSLCLVPHAIFNTQQTDCYVDIRLHLHCEDVMRMRVLRKSSMSIYFKKNRGTFVCSLRSSSTMK